MRFYGSEPSPTDEVTLTSGPELLRKQGTKNHGLKACVCTVCVLDPTPQLKSLTQVPILDATLVFAIIKFSLLTEIRDSHAIYVFSLLFCVA